MKKKKVFLTLENGDVFQGYRFGADGDVIAKLVFNTSMVGYMETLTDPCAYGQMIVQTFPLIGNYGKIEKDVESEKAWCSAYIVREICDAPSNFRMEGTLDEYLKAQGVVGVYGVDTRQLTKVLREYGTLNAKISDKPALEDYDEIAAYQVKNAVENTAPKCQKVFGEDNSAYTVALWNFGEKNSSIQTLVSLGAKVISMPASATAEEILALNPDGIVLSNGAGDPNENVGIIEQVKKVLGKKPVFGVGLGHQLVALACGAEVVEMKYGHRGGNQPVKDLQSGCVYITAQNHGYEVLKESVQQGEVRFINVNDNSCEGIFYEDLKALTVQFTPETFGVGHTENPLFDKFFDLMRKEKENA